MTRSMTAFARTEQKTDAGDLIWEIRSVNHRYLELHLKMPETFRAQETRFRTLLQSRLNRGKVECYLRFNVSEQQSEDVTINTTRAKALVHACQEINDLLHQPSEVDPMEVLQWPGVVQESKLDMKPIYAACEEALSCALDDLLSNREREGARMREVILQRCDAIQSIVNQARANMPEIQERYQKKLRERLDALNIEG